MVKLFCSLVGVKGNAFAVTIDASELMVDLKKVIKKEKESDFKSIDADKLQLFLAKTGDDRKRGETCRLHQRPKAFECCASEAPPRWLVQRGSESR
jgi:reverse gyrase